eukprot:COSAG05_NODE_1614_length_4406_cov_2.286510_2_plen_72_part_00
MAPRLSSAHADMVSTGPSGPTCYWSGPVADIKFSAEVGLGVDCSGWVWRHGYLHGPVGWRGREGPRRHQGL